MANSKKTSRKRDKAKKLPQYTKEEIRFNDLFTNAVDQRGSSCFWGEGETDWEDRWDLQDKLAIMWFGEMNEDEGYNSNIKSPEIAGRIQSTMHKLSKVNLEFVVKPRNEASEFVAKVAQVMLNASFKNGNYKFRLREAFYDALRHGTAPVLVDFMNRTRKVRVAVTKEDQMTKEEKKNLKDKGEVPYREYIMIDKRDVVLIPKRIQEIYFDPNARNIHGDVDYASYYFDTVKIPYDRFKKIYKDKMGYKDIDKVRKAGELEDERFEDMTITPPADSEGDFVYLVKMWDFDNDRYMERANDIFIKECPLPYNHKKLNIVNLTPFKLPDQMYGISLVDFLLPIVNQIELLQNSINDYVTYTTNPILMVNSSDYNEFARHYKDARPGLMLPTRDVARNVAPLKYMPLSMDVFQALSSLQRDAVIASQQDPSQLGMVMKNATATANVINKEVTDAYVNFTLENFIESLNMIAYMVLSLQYQFLTYDDVYDTLNGNMEKETIKEPRVLRLDDMELDIDWDAQTINVVEKPGETSYMELKPEMFKNGEGRYITPFDLSIELSTESIEIMSKALKIQQSKENFAQLSQYMVDTSDPAKIAQHPMPLIDAVSFMDEYFETNGINRKHLINKKKQLSVDIENAMDQNRQMFNLDRPIPHPGESKEHIKVHEEFLNAVAKMRDKMQEEINAIVSQTGMPIDPMQYSTKYDQINRLQQVAQIAAEHIGIDMMPAYTSGEVAKQKASPMQRPEAGGMGGNTQMGGVGNMGGGNPPMPNPIGGAGMQGGPGQMGGLTG